MTTESSIADTLNSLVEQLASHLDDAEPIDQKGYGWKSANKRMRKTAQEVRNSLKDFRAASIKLEQAG